jgi:hypothetical protein
MHALDKMPLDEDRLIRGALKFQRRFGKDGHHLVRELEEAYDQIGSASRRGSRADEHPTTPSGSMRSPRGFE